MYFLDSTFKSSIFKRLLNYLIFFLLDPYVGWLHFVCWCLQPFDLTQKIRPRWRWFSTSILGGCYSVPNQFWHLCIFFGCERGISTVIANFINFQRNFTSLSFFMVIFVKKITERRLFEKFSPLNKSKHFLFKLELIFILKLQDWQLDCTLIFFLIKVRCIKNTSSFLAMSISGS